MDSFAQTALREPVARQNAFSLRQAGRFPPVPFAVQLADKQTVTVVRLLRVLPGKRITGEGLLNNERVLVKLFIAKGGSRHCRREYRGITALEKAGIPSPQLKTRCVLAGGGCALLTGFLEPSETLAEAWASAQDCREKDELLVPAFRLLGQMHAAGLIHNDLHPGNFLRHSGTLYLIDGDAVRSISPGRPLNGRRAFYQAAKQISSMPVESRADLGLLLNAYREGNPVFRPDPERLWNAVLRIRSKGVARFLKKSVRDSTLFSVHCNFFCFTSVVRRQAGTLAGLTADPDRAIDEGVRLKTGGSSTVARIELPEQPVVIKRYNLKSRAHAFSRLWRPSRAWRSWMTGLRLRQAGLAAPEPLALIEERFGPLRRRAWLITEFCPGKNLKEHLDETCEPPPAEAAALLSFFETLCRERISHGDLKATNLLWHENRPVILDLDAARKHFFAVTHRRAWRKDRTRLLRNWPDGSVLRRWLDEHLPA